MKNKKANTCIALMIVVIIICVCFIVWLFLSRPETMTLYIVTADGEVPYQAIESTLSWGWLIVPIIVIFAALCTIVVSVINKKRG